MRRISDILEEIVLGNLLFQSGLQDRLINLSRLAEILQPMISARAGKSVSLTSIHMALSRLQSKIAKGGALRSDQLEIQSVTVHSDLCVLNFFKNQELHAKVNQLYTRVQSANGYMTITEGINEITLIIDARNLALARKTLLEKPRRLSENISAVAVKFSERFLNVPGYLYRIIQLFAFQNINIVELGSTATELIIYISTNDIRVAFETLLARAENRRES